MEGIRSGSGIVFEVATTSSFLKDYWPVIGVGVTVILALSSAWGRHTLSKLFRGQSIERLTATASEQIETVRAAYEVVNAELARQREEYEARIKELLEKIDSQAERIAALEDLVRGTKEIEALTAQAQTNHAVVMQRLDDLYELQKAASSGTH
jgi:hypothetical protein